MFISISTPLRIILWSIIATATLISLSHRSFADDAKLKESEVKPNSRRYVTLAVGGGFPQLIQVDARVWLGRRLSLDGKVTGIPPLRTFGGGGGLSGYFFGDGHGHHLVCAFQVVHMKYDFLEFSGNLTFVGPQFGYAYLGDRIEFRLAVGADIVSGSTHEYAGAVNHTSSNPSPVLPNVSMSVGFRF